MKLYLLRVDTHEYDAYDAHLVRAESEQEARDLCPNSYEGKAAWQTAKCVELTADGSSGVILSSGC